VACQRCVKNKTVAGASVAHQTYGSASLGHKPNRPFVWHIYFYLWKQMNGYFTDPEHA
jgi:hypothetical protein